MSAPPQWRHGCAHRASSPFGKSRRARYTSRTSPLSCKVLRRSAKAPRAASHAAPNRVPMSGRRCGHCNGRASADVSSSSSIPTLAMSSSKSGGCRLREMNRSISNARSNGSSRERTASASSSFMTFPGLLNGHSSQSQVAQYLVFELGILEPELDQVTDADDAGHLALMHHDNVTYTPLGHDAEDLVHRVVRQAGRRWTFHRLGHGALEGGDADPGHGTKHVPVGDDPEGIPCVVDHHDGGNIALVE